jgi:hypothetical protein
VHLDPVISSPAQISKPLNFFLFCRFTKSAHFRYTRKPEIEKVFLTFIMSSCPRWKNQSETIFRAMKKIKICPVKNHVKSGRR